MKTIELLHRKSFWMASLLSVIVPVLVGFSMQRLPEVDRFIDLRRAQEATNIAERGGLVESDIRRALAKDTLQGMDQLMYLGRGINLTSALPALAPIMKLVEETAQTTITTIAAISDKGTISRDSTTNYQLLNLARTAGQLAEAKAGAGEWDDALSYFSAMARISSLCMFYDQGFVRMGPYPAVDLARNLYELALSNTEAAQVLTELDSQLAMLERRQAPPMSNRVNPLFHIPASIEHSVYQRAFLESVLASMYDQLHSRGQEFYSSQYPDPPPFLPWTGARGAIASIKSLVNSYPHLADEKLAAALGLTPAEDDVIRAMQIHELPFLTWRFDSQSNRIALTRAHLLHVALAVSQFKARTGKYPEKLDELDSEFVNPRHWKEIASKDPGLFSTEQIIDRNKPIGPLKGGMVPITENNVLALLNLSLGTNASNFNSSFEVRIHESTPGKKRVNLRWHSFNDNDFINIVLAKHALEFRPESPTTATLYVRERESTHSTEVDSAFMGLKPAPPELLANPLSVAYGLEQRSRELEKVLPELVRYEQVAIEADIEVPSEVYAVWSPGIDGKDQMALSASAEFGYRITDSDLVQFVR